MANYLCYCVLAILTWLKAAQSVPSRTNGEAIAVVGLPRYLDHGMNINLEYRCTGPQRFGLMIYTPTQLHPTLQPFKFAQKCKYMPNKGQISVTVFLPSRIAYKPSYTNTVSLTIKSTATVIAWILDESDYEFAEDMTELYEYALAQKTYYLMTRSPYERPEAPPTSCPSWWWSVELQKPFQPQCPYEHEMYRAVVFPLVLSGSRHGVHRQYPKYQHKLLVKNYPRSLNNPSFTISIWLYIIEYCPEKTSFCSIVQHLTWDDRYMTPLIFIKPNGQLHFQVVTAQGEPIAHLIQAPFPLEQWCHMVASFSRNRWDISIRCPAREDKEERRITREMILPGSKLIWNEDTAESMVFGGSEVCPSFRGYIGSATVYRLKAKRPIDIPAPHPFHPMFELDLGHESFMCEKLQTWVKFRMYQAKILLQTIIEKRSCAKSDYYTFLEGKKTVSQFRVCKIYKGPKRKARAALSHWIKRTILDGQEIDEKDIGKLIYANASARITEEGHSAIPKIVPWLMQASCLGYHDASYMLAVIYNNGFSVRSEEKLVQHYLLRAAMGRHPLSLLALAHKHRYGLDGFPIDPEQAYVYLKSAADKTRDERETHKEQDMFAEKVRLTDEDALDAQTDEDGDLFQWFRHQAAQGAVHAQRNLARLYFWGSQGIQRNLERAVEYYRLGAESMDPEALFDYGIVLLKGIGVKQNMTAALEHLRKAAEMGHMQAINAVGWYELEVAKNYSEAKKLFMDSYNRGSPDAAHNLGHMYMNDLIPGHDGPDRINAFKYFSAGAMRGQVDSALMIALFNMRGHPNAVRNVNLALEWARFVAEQSGQLGRALSTAVKSYRKGNWDAAVLEYMIAAETGIEIGCFNLAHLCELNKDYITSYIEKECIWRFYNLSTLRDFQHVDPYAWIKMGDYWWYGCQGKRNPREAALLYANAALHSDPHALFNLGYLVEEGIHMPDKVWHGLNFPEESLQSNITLLTEIYSRCKVAKNSEAYLPCSLALLKLQAVYYWNKYHVVLKLSSAVGSMAVTTLTLVAIYSYFRQNRQTVDSV